MRTIRSARAMQRQAWRWRGASVRVGLVPTMGFLHAGHLALMAAARRWVGPNGKVVVSIYVNPTQFAPAEDFSRYPRDLAMDSRLCRDAGVDIIFAPRDEQMYPGREEGSYSTYVQEEQLSQGMEGEARPSHFRGVTTVVAKLFNLVVPEVAVFGEKDFQQAAVVRRMAKDLNFPVRIAVAPTRREPDGLAMSSRNLYLEGEQRLRARVLSEALGFARGLVRGARRAVWAGSLRERVLALANKSPGVRVEYIEFFDPRTLRPVSRVTRGSRMALAVRVGNTRLIDNGPL